MRINFWLKTWNEGNIGFHQAQIHAALENHWPQLPAGTQVLVPLCGKSRDMLWLEERGFDVTGVEFVESAVRDFFSESGLAFEKTEQYGHPCYQAEDRNIRLFCTDFIQLAEDYDGPKFPALYDRAALVALPHDMRPPYVAACRKLLGPAPKGLLVSMTYEPQSMEGPPFSVEPGEVEHLWGDDLELIGTTDMLASMPRAVAAGVERLDEYFWEFK
ncbi:MAG: thiopurine S-methyltransferase [Lysobacterales bacterium]